MTNWLPCCPTDNADRYELLFAPDACIVHNCARPVAQYSIWEPPGSRHKIIRTCDQHAVPATDVSTDRRIHGYLRIVDVAEIRRLHYDDCVEESLHVAEHEGYLRTQHGASPLVDTWRQRCRQEGRPFVFYTPGRVQFGVFAHNLHHTHSPQSRQHADTLVAQLCTDIDKLVAPDAVWFGATYERLDGVASVEIPGHDEDLAMQVVRLCIERLSVVCNEDLFGVSEVLDT